MDLHNNAIGRSIGATNLTATDVEMAELVLQQMKFGQLRFLYPLSPENDLVENSNLIPSYKGCQK